MYFINVESAVLFGIINQPQNYNFSPKDYNKLTLLAKLAESATEVPAIVESAEQTTRSIRAVNE